MVFQIADDALDLLADEETIGKPAGSDIREGTFTAPVLMAAAGPDRHRIASLLGDGMPYTDAVVNEVIDLVRAGGFVDLTLEDALHRLDRAETALDAVPDIEARAVLKSLGGFLLERVETARA